jgi:hypothetical protein
MKADNALYMLILISILLAGVVLLSLGMSSGNDAKLNVDNAGQIKKGEHDAKTDRENIFVVIQEYPEWEPGMTRVMNQIVIKNDGSGQKAVIRDSRITELETFFYPASDFEKLDMTSFYSMKNLYAASSPKDNELILEGYASTIKFIFFNQTRYKIIDAELSVMPEALSNLKNRIDNLATTSHCELSAGTYVAAQLLGTEEAKEVRAITSPHDLPSEKLISFPSLSEALTTPSILVHVSTPELKDISKYYQLNISDESGFFVKQGWGIAKINFYHADTLKR